MKIKLHNSLCLQDVNCLFLFSQGVYVSYVAFRLYLHYNILDLYPFISFFPETETFETDQNFGKKTRTREENWWKDSIYDWKEMSE